MYLRQPSRSSRRASFSIKQFSLPISFPFLLTCVLFRLGDHLVEPLSPRSRAYRLISVDFSFLSLISLSPLSAEKWEKNQKVFAASDARVGPVIGCPGRSQQPRLEIRQDRQRYSLRGHGRAHGKLHAFDFRHIKIRVFPLARPDLWVSDTLGTVFCPRHTGTSAPVRIPASKV
jgi:hypothetical protein